MVKVLWSRPLTFVGRAPNVVERLVTWVLLVPFFFLRVAIGEEDFDLRLRWLQLPVLAVLVVLHTKLNDYFRVVAAAFVAIAAIQVMHAIAYQMNPRVGSFLDYQLAFLRVWLYLFLVCAAAIQLLHREHFVHVFLRLSMISVGIGVVAVLIRHATGLGVLIHSYGDLHRMQAFLSEPSAFAPVVAFLLLAAYRLRSVGLAATGAAGLLFSFSPVVALSTGIAFVLFVLLQPQRQFKLLTVGLVLGTVSLSILASVDYNSLVQSDFGWQVTLGRLILGFQSVLSGGEEGVNDRFAGFLNVLEFMESESSASFLTGLGFNASAVVFNLGDYEVFDHALWITFLFSYGVGGAVAIVLLGLLAGRILLRRNDMFALLYLAFFSASLVNSAQGFVSYAFVLLGFAVALKDSLSRTPVRNAPRCSDHSAK